MLLFPNFSRQLTDVKSCLGQLLSDGCYNKLISSANITGLSRTCVPLLQATLQDAEAQLAQLHETTQAQQSELETRAQDICALQQLASERQALVESSTAQVQETEHRLAQDVVTLQV